MVKCPQSNSLGCSISKCKNFVNLQLNLSNTCSSLKYLFPTSSNTVSIVFCSVKSFFDHHDCIFEEYRERGVSTGCFIVKLIIEINRCVLKASNCKKNPVVFHILALITFRI